MTMWTLRRLLGAFAVVVLAQPVAAAGPGTPGTGDLTARAQRFRQLVSRRQFDSARLMMAPDARRWWGSKEGPGQPWTVEPSAPGPWAAWDDHFKTRREVVQWTEAEQSASVLTRETNDYFQLLEIGWVQSELTYFFDTSGRISGFLIHAVGERAEGRRPEFEAWARENHPDEMDELMPDGEIDPTADHPTRFRALLLAWRKAVGLP